MGGLCADCGQLAFAIVWHNESMELMRIALGLEYDGIPFCGWQSQPQKCGVQDFLEAALAEVAGHVVTVHAAGRTDAGVHALMQVVHFDTDVKRPVSAWVRGVNAHLPAGIRVLWAKLVKSDFHARFSAEGRSYQYLLLNRSVASAVLAAKVGWFHAPLDVSAMQIAVQHFMGEHDFSAFRASECQAKTPVKTISHASVKRIDDILIFEFSASAFLQHQVRNMVGALVYVGKGKHSPEFITTLLDSRDRTLAPPTFSSDGLYLVGVKYAKDWGLPDTMRSLKVLS